ncbi:MAG: hypothetical protein ABIU95_08565 [Burkholderiales bacterium]
MTTTPVPARAAPEPSRRLIQSAIEYDAGVTALIERAHRDLAIVDPDGLQLHLNSLARITALEAFLRQSPTNEITIVLRRIEHVATECPRLIEVLRRVGVRMRIHSAIGDAARTQDCFVIADELHCVRRPVATQARGVMIEHDAAEIALQRERFGQILASSEVAVSATTLGL